ncbi:MAG TPA: TlpA disulfide reductase family protein [Chthonomonadales bacterium]|nr:TlpA disulfide reductase family protein [Chthonomonadales bacterium]
MANIIFWMTLILNFRPGSSKAVYLPEMKPKNQQYLAETASPGPSRKVLPVVLLGLGVVLIAGSAYFILQDRPALSAPSTVPVQVNFAAPELTLKDTYGVTHSLADYRGQVVLVNLWATWCPPCKEEMPILQAFYKKHARDGFVIIAVNDGDPEADVLQFVEDYELTFPVWLDPTYIATERAFKTLNLPSSFVIDRNGTVRLMWVGGISRRMLEKHVTPLIMENQ